MSEAMESVIRTIKKIDRIKGRSELDEVERLSIKHKFYQLTVTEMLYVVACYPSYEEFSNRYCKEILGIVHENQQLELVREDGLSISKIKDPSEAVKIEAVMQNGWAIRYIKHPSEHVQLAAIRQDYRCMSLISNPSKKVKKEFKRIVRENKNKTQWELKMLDDLSEESQLKLVSNCGIMLKYISKQSAAVQAAALENDPSASKYIVIPQETEEFPTEKFDLLLDEITDSIIESVGIQDEDGLKKIIIVSLLKVQLTKK